MAKLTKEKFIESLNEMNLLEINELVNAMKEEYGIDPTAVAVAQSASTAVATEEGPSVFDVILKEAGATKIAVIKIIRDVTGLGLKEAKDIADAGGVVKEKLSTEEANTLKESLEAAGATVELK